MDIDPALVAEMLADRLSKDYAFREALLQRVVPNLNHQALQVVMQTAKESCDKVVKERIESPQFNWSPIEDRIKNSVTDAMVERMVLRVVGGAIGGEIKRRVKAALGAIARDP